jgi:hypothetical protein
VSCKFVYQQANKARLALALMCRGSYLGIIEFMRDVLGACISMGTVHNVLRSAAEQAGVINGAQDLSRIRTGLHDELFHGGDACSGWRLRPIDLLLSPGRGAPP